MGVYDNVLQYDPIIQSAAQEWGIDPHWIKAVMQQETGGNRTKNGKPIVSSAGAGGIMQIMPGTAAELGVTDVHDPQQAIYGGAKYLRQMLDKYGNVTTATAAYNAGPNKTDAVLAGRDTFRPETLAYVPAVSSHYRAFSGAPSVQVAGPGAPTSQLPPPTRELPQTGTVPRAPGAENSPEDAFLKRTGGAVQGATTRDDPETAFLTRTGGKPEPTTPSVVEPTVTPEGVPTNTPSWTPSWMPTRASLGIPAAGANGELATLAPGAEDNMTVGVNAGPAIGQIAKDALAGARRAFGADPVGIGPKLDQGLRSAGVFPPEGKTGNPLQMINEGLLRPLGTAADLGLRGVGALYGGLQAGVNSGLTMAGVSPQAARDIVSIPDAFMGSPGMLERGQRRQPMSPATPSGEMLRGNPLVANEVALPVEFARDPGVLRPQTDLPPAPVSVNPLVPSSVPLRPAEVGPGSVGAAASRDMAIGPLPQKNQAAVKVDLQKDVLQSAEDRAGPQMRDDTVYVPGVQRPLAAREFNPQNAVDEKMLRESDPIYDAHYKAIEKSNNETMLDYLRSDAGDDNALAAAHDAREATAPPALHLFENEKPVDASKLVGAIDTMLAGPAGKRGAVNRILTDVKSKLFSKDGELETLPSQLYGARQNITDWLKKGSGSGDLAADAKLAKAQLADLLKVADPIIGEGAPKFLDYLKDFSEASKPIDQMEFLQGYMTGSKKLTDKDGYLQLNKVQKMVDDIYQGVRKPGVNPAKSLSEDQIQKIVAVRNELAANALRDRLARTKGADTFQKSNRAGVLGAGPLGTAIKGAADLAVHGALLALPGSGFTNALYATHRHVLAPTLAVRAAGKRANALEARKSQLLGNENPLISP